VDPEAAIAEGLATLLNTYGIDVECYPDAETFLRSRKTHAPARGCLVVEADLPGVSGPALIERLDGGPKGLPVVLMVSTSSPELIAVASASDRICVIEKPCVDDTLVQAILRIRNRN
jgi:two-component system CheB/CheR fusion protein